MNKIFTTPAPAAGHPIRRMIANGRRPVAVPPRPTAQDSDVKLFALSFTAFFICIYTLIF